MLSGDLQKGKVYQFKLPQIYNSNFERYRYEQSNGFSHYDCTIFFFRGAAISGNY